MKKIRFFLAGLTTIIFLLSPWWLPRVVLISLSVYAMIGFGGGLLLLFLWCWVLSAKLFARVVLKLAISIGGAVGYVFTIGDLGDLSLDYPRTAFLLVLMCLIGAIISWLSCLYWPEFDKEDIKA